MSKGGILKAGMGTPMTENRHSKIKQKEPDREFEYQSPKREHSGPWSCKHGD